MKSLSLLFILTLLFSCGKSTTKDESKLQIAKADSLLNAKQYEDAIISLENIQSQNPSDKEVNIKLAHAYAGAGKFESISFFLSLVDIDKKIKEKEWDKVAIKSMTAHLIKSLSSVPSLNSREKKRLNQAISLYHDMGLEVETANNELNFKWGVLHTYRLIINLKEMISEIDLMVTTTDAKKFKYTEEEIEKFFIKHIKLFSVDFYESYKLYSHSYEKLKNIAASLDSFINNTFGNKDLKLKISKTIKNNNDFLKQFIKDNTHFASVIFSKLTDMFKENHLENIKEIFSSNLPVKEMKESQIRLTIGLEQILKNLDQNHQAEEEKLKGIFTEEFKVKFVSALEDSIEMENTLPLKNFLNSSEKEVLIIKECYEVLKKEAAGETFSKMVKAETEMLLKKVDLEQIKKEMNTVLIQLQKDIEVFKLSGDIVQKQNIKKLYQQKIFLQTQYKIIAKEIEAPLIELQDALIKENADQAKMEKIIAEVDRFVQDIQE